MSVAPRPKDLRGTGVRADVKALAATLLALGCTSEPPPRAPPREAQSYDQAMNIMCNVDALAGVDASDPLETEAKRADYLVLHVKNSDGIYLLTLFRTSDPRGQASLLEDGVAGLPYEHGHCPLLTTLRASAEDTPPAPTPTPAARKE